MEQGAERQLAVLRACHLALVVHLEKGRSGGAGGTPVLLATDLLHKTARTVRSCR